MAFRKQVDNFLNINFKQVCSANCYQNQLSACCSKDSIITFFADAVINCLYSDDMHLEKMAGQLSESNESFKCVYLNDDGCLWRIKPIVCVMFLCDKAKKEVFSLDPKAGQTWKKFRKKEKTFKWPDQPVLFDDLENVFIKAGFKSSLMHLNYSPGLLFIKKKAGLIESPSIDG